MEPEMTHIIDSRKPDKTICGLSRPLAPNQISERAYATTHIRTCAACRRIYEQSW